MKPEHNLMLDDMLSRWHSWQLSNPAARGYARCSAGFEQYRSSRQHSIDDLEADVDNSRCKQVDFEVREMQDPYRSAIYFEARNLSTGRRVWTSPRLPQDIAERSALIQQSRGMLCVRLVNSGVI